jgi:hypothetical protein
MQVLSAQVILIATLLVATRSVRPRQVARAGVLLTVKKTSVQYTYTVITIVLPLLAYCELLR